MLWSQLCSYQLHGQDKVPKPTFEFMQPRMGMALMTRGSWTTVMYSLQ